MIWVFQSLFVCSFCCLLNDLSAPFSVCVLFLLFIDWSECSILCLCVVSVVYWLVWVFHSLFVCCFCCLLIGLSVPFSVVCCFCCLLIGLSVPFSVCSFCCILIGLSVPISVCVLFLLFIDWSKSSILCLCVVSVFIEWSECSILCVFFCCSLMFVCCFCCLLIGLSVPFSVCVLFLLFIEWFECSNLCLCVVSVVYWMIWVLHSLFVCCFCCLLIGLSVPISVCV